MRNIVHALPIVRSEVVRDQVFGEVIRLSGEHRVQRDFLRAVVLWPCVVVFNADATRSAPGMTQP
jgi:hypothetical protein